MERMASAKLPTKYGDFMIRVYEEILGKDIELAPDFWNMFQGMKSTSVRARLDGSILQVSCEQLFVNDGSRPEEVEILLPIPADAVVTDGMLLADGQEIRAEVLPADEARAIYERIVRQRRDPAPRRPRRHRAYRSRGRARGQDRCRGGVDRGR